MAVGWHDCTCNPAFRVTTGLWAAWCPSAGAPWAGCPSSFPTCGGLIHRWPRGKAVKWVQWFLDPIRIQARTATGVQLKDEKGDKKKGLRLEQTAPAEWVKSEGWDCIADHLEQDGLLQHVADMGGGQVSWTDNFHQWGKSLLATSNVAWKSGPLQMEDFTILFKELKTMGDAHKACGMTITLWAHLWIDHLPFAKP